MDIKLPGRIPPHNPEAEQSVLGSMLLDGDAVAAAAEILKSDDFYREGNREIFESMLELVDRGEPIDLITVTEQLRGKGALETVGGVEYLAAIAGAVPTTSNIRHYARIVEEKSLLRKLIRTASDIVNLGYEGGDDTAYIIDRAQQQIFDLMQKRDVKGFIHIRDILVEAFSRLDELYNNKEAFTGIPSGFIDLDYMTSGFQNSDLVLIASRPSMGKTSFALNIAQNVAIQRQKPVAVFSLEMSKEQLASRLLCSEAMVDSSKMRTGRLEDGDWTKLATALGPLSEAPIYIDDSSASSIMEIRAKCRRLKAEKNISMVIIDYLQLMQGKGSSENRQQEISEITRSLKILAKEINVPILTCSQLSRAVEARSDHRPMLSDLRESGAIEQDADLVIFLYREDYYKKDTNKKNIAEVIIAKHRNGSIGTMELVWLGQYTKFANKAHDNTVSTMSPTSPRTRVSAPA